MSAPQPAPRVVRIGTRSSELALRQARLVEAALAARGVPSELVTYTTVGDRNLDVALSAIGAKGLFTQELEDDLRGGRVDCCVHSLKDLPTASPEGLLVVAQLEREDPRDALVLGPALRHSARAGTDDRGPIADALALLPTGARVGTSSLRRRALLLALRPDLHVRGLRGNVPTRLRKVDAGDEVDAAVLAAAGLHRLDLHERVDAYLGAPAWLPAAGQGAIAVQVRADDAPMRTLVASLDHAPTTAATRCERAFLAALEGGCQVPIGALVVMGDDGRHALHGFISSVDGRTVVRDSYPVNVAEPEGAGVMLAARLRADGGDDVLAGLRDIRGIPAPQPE